MGLRLISSHRPTPSSENFCLRVYTTLTLTLYWLTFTGTRCILVAWPNRTDTAHITNTPTQCTKVSTRYSNMLGIAMSVIVLALIVIQQCGCRLCCTVLSYTENWWINKSVHCAGSYKIKNLPKLNKKIDCIRNINKKSERWWIREGSYKDNVSSSFCVFFRFVFSCVFCVFFVLVLFYVFSIQL